MRSNHGIYIEEVAEGSPAYVAGLHPDDLIVSINSIPVGDVIDYMFLRDSDRLNIEYIRDGVKKNTVIISDTTGDQGITVKPFKVKTCKNNCIFCFVKQLPKGLRRNLYVKDEDYRLSFLYGNYITLSNITDDDRKRIVTQRISPLYLSVHSTNTKVRNKMLGNANMPDIMKELKFFSENKIRMHIQIVLCPGYNDGEELKSTLRDLIKFYPYVSSVAVVPVGLTKHRRQLLNPVSKEDALNTIKIVEIFQKRMIKKHGEAVIYCADEMYIKAEHPFPPLKEYDGLPQIENGVGMVPLFIHQSRKVKFSKQVPKNIRLLTFTGKSFYPFLKKFINRITEKENLHIDLIPIENDFFGHSITVTGLLTGRDVIKAVHDIAEAYNILIVPDVVLKEDEDIFLDDVSLRDIEEATGLKTIKTESSPQGLIDAITLLS